jgi:hypothetical protein
MGSLPRNLPPSDQRHQRGNSSRAIYSKRFLVIFRGLFQAVLAMDSLGDCALREANLDFKVHILKSSYSDPPKREHLRRPRFSRDNRTQTPGGCELAPNLDQTPR